MTIDPLASLQNVLPVGLIGTPRRDFETCLPTETIGAVVRRNGGPFDYLPVKQDDHEGAARIVGLLHIEPFMAGANPDALVSEYFERLSESNLLGADAGLLDFVRSADGQRCRLIISGREISGLVTLSDLQQLPVRASLFAWSHIWRS